MENETATEQSMQDITNSIEEKLFPSSNEEPDEVEGEVVLEDEATLPEGDDTDSDENEGSEDKLDDIAEEEELTLADYLGIDDEKLTQSEEGAWMFKAVIDGEEKDVPLSELAKSFQLQGHVNNKSISLEQERKEFQEQQLKVSDDLKQRTEGLETMAKVLEQEIISEYQGIDWDTLRSTDPVQWTALRQEFAERAQRVQHSQQLILEEAKRANDEAFKHQEAAMQQHVEAERSSMLEKNPTWNDGEVFKKDMGELRTFVQSTYGFSDDDTKLVTDHRLVQLIQDAHKYHNGTKQAAVKKEKVVPKFQKSGATKQKASQLAKARAVKARKHAVKKSGGSTDAVANLLIDRM